MLLSKLRNYKVQWEGEVDISGVKYMRDMARELAEMAVAQGRNSLSYIFRMAELEAKGEIAIERGIRNRGKHSKTPRSR